MARSPLRVRTLLALVAVGSLAMGLGTVWRGDRYGVYVLSVPPRDGTRTLVLNARRFEVQLRISAATGPGIPSANAEYLCIPAEFLAVCVLPLIWAGAALQRIASARRSRRKGKRDGSVTR